MFRKIVFISTILLAWMSLGFRSLSSSYAAQQPQSRSRIEQEMEDKRFHEANKHRQEEIRQDTQKLFQLASDLKAAVEKTDENVMSIEVIKKAEEVEKLAKKVKDKMKEGTAKLPPPIPVPTPNIPH
ncbi:MAG TPA: hypothetical protein VG649_01740 [Candidatus Angelobacter sp.]|nr:hypothetical protein [Candidatus Angelobacter sp.]